MCPEKEPREPSKQERINEMGQDLGKLATGLFERFSNADTSEQHVMEIIANETRNKIEELKRMRESKE